MTEFGEKPNPEHEVYIIESDSDIQQSIRDSLETISPGITAHVLFLSNIEDVEKALTEENFDPKIIVTELRIGKDNEENGMDLIRALKAPNSPHKDIPLVVLSTSPTDSREAEECLKLGVDAYIDKGEGKEGMDKLITKIEELTKK